MLATYFRNWNSLGLHNVSSINEYRTSRIRIVVSYRCINMPMPIQNAVQMKRTKVIKVQSLYGISFRMTTGKIGSYCIRYSLKCISIALVSITIDGILYF